MKSLPTLVCTLVVWIATGGLVSPAAQADGTYVALGDSVAAPADSYVHVLFGALRVPEGGGLDRLYNRARGGEDSTTLRTNGQLAAAIADIDSPSDTKVVTIDIGGNDRFACGGPPPSWHLSSCPLGANLGATLGDLQAALERDPGPESLVVMTYYNPASATGTTEEQDLDRGLLGTDLQLYCAPSGDPRLGLNDQLACIAASRGALVADVYPAFKAGGQPLLNGIHPTSRGQAVIAEEFSKTLGIPAPPPFDTTRPVLNVTGSASQKVLRRHGVLVVARSPAEGCTVTATGTVKVRGGSRLFYLRSVTRQVAQGGRTKLKLRLERRAFRAIASALRAGKTVRAKITVTARDAAGNVTTKRRTITLKG